MTEPLPSTSFDIHLLDGAHPIDLSLDFTARPVDAYYFSLLTAFESRATKATLAPGRVVSITTTDDDSGDLLPEDFFPAPLSGGEELTLSRSALGLLLRQAGLFISERAVVISSPRTRLGQALFEIISRFVSLDPKRTLTVDKVDASEVFSWSSA